MNTIVLNSEEVRIPNWVIDLAAFRRWANSDEFPESGRVCFLNGEVWVDVSREQFFTHNQVKGEFNRVLGSLPKATRSGRYVPDGMLLTNVEADLCCRPDGAFVSYQSLDSGRVQLVAGVEEGTVELEGAPDIVLEVVSASSARKDTDTLRELYWRAGIPEYWLVDARGDRLHFEILRHTEKGYVGVRKQGGWLRSTVLGRSFRLIAGTDDRGDPEFTLAER